MTASNPYQPMNASDLFMAQNLGLNPSAPPPMPGMMPSGASQPMAGPQNVQMPPEIQHLGDVLQQYTQNKQDQQNNSGLVQQILSNRMQPELQDASRSVFQSNQNGSYVDPSQAMAQRYQSELAPYTQGLGLANQNAELTGRLNANNIQQLTGLPAAQADIAMKNAQAGYYGSALQRDLAEKAFSYANDPQMLQSKAMANLLSGVTGGQSQGGANLPQAMQQNGQPQIPIISRGAILDKLGMVTEGQKEQDKNFADSWQTYSNAGGALRTQNAIATVDNAINQLKSGQLGSGGLMDRLSMNPNGEPSWTGMLANAPILVARNQIASAILPQAKALFGARVTNFDAQSLINSQGLDPLAPPDVNIQKLERLKSSLISGQQDLINSGQYFQNNGTLSGYQSPSAQQNSQQNIGQQQSIIQEGSTATNPQTGQKIIYKNGQWGSM